MFCGKWWNLVLIALFQLFNPESEVSTFYYLFLCKYVYLEDKSWYFPFSKSSKIISISLLTQLCSFSYSLLKKTSRQQQKETMNSHKLKENFKSNQADKWPIIFLNGKLKYTNVTKVYFETNKQMKQKYKNTIEFFMFGAVIPGSDLSWGVVI